MASATAANENGADRQGRAFQPGVATQTPLWKAFERFSNTLDPEEKATFTGVTLDDVLVHVRTLDQLHYSPSKLRLFSSRLEPLVRFLDRQARALDCMVQVHPYPSALIWGIVRVILEVIF